MQDIVVKFYWKNYHVAYLK